jgi:general stress protein YciG
MKIKRVSRFSIRTTDSRVAHLEHREEVGRDGGEGIRRVRGHGGQRLLSMTRFDLNSMYEPQDSRVAHLEHREEVGRDGGERVPRVRGHGGQRLEAPLRVPHHPAHPAPHLRLLLKDPHLTRKDKFEDSVS